MYSMNTRSNRFFASTQPLRASSQSGFVLVIALIVLAAMTLAAAAMVRTVDTSTLLARNISFKRDALNRNDVALEVAINQFRVGGAFPGGTLTDNSIAAQNYSAVMLPTDPNGIPLVLKAATRTDPPALPADTNPLYAFPGGTRGSAEPATIPVALDLGMTPTYLIERMCTKSGPISTESCILNGKAEGGGTLPNRKPPQIFPTMFRITARVTGPRNTVSYVQAIFSLQNT